MTPAPPADGRTAATESTGDPRPEDLRLLRQTLRDALDELSPPAQVRQQMATGRGWDAMLWRRLCRELGLAGLAVPADYGGGGFSQAELGVAFEEAGRSLLCAPLLATVGLAVPLLLTLDDEQARRRYLPGLCDGSLTGTAVTGPAVTACPDGASPEQVPVRAVGHGGQWRLHGTVSHVVDGQSADVILVPAATEAGLGVFAVRAGAPGLAVTPLVTLDLTRKQARLAFDGVAADQVGPPDAARAAGRALDVARALLAAEQAGGAGRCLEMTVQHAKTRVQFGRPIGSFQAVKQKVADMLIRVESARSAAAAATAAAALALRPGAALAPGPGAALALRPGADLPELAVTAAVAQAYCSEAFVAVAADAIQLHGGIGFTWEHDAHLYFKRAWTSAELLGRPAEHYETIARYLAAP